MIRQVMRQSETYRMLLERRTGQVGKQRAVEAAHQELTGQVKPYFQIALEIYSSRFPTARQVKEQVEKRYSVVISEKTAGQWINRGMAEARPEQPVAGAVA